MRIVFISICWILCVGFLLGFFFIYFKISLGNRYIVIFFVDEEVKFRDVSFKVLL